MSKKPVFIVVFLFLSLALILPSLFAAQRKNSYGYNPSAYDKHKEDVTFQSAMSATGHAFAVTGKGLWRGTYWTGKMIGKGVYETGKFITTELFRPFVPARNKLVDSFGVEVRES